MSGAEKGGKCYWTIMSIRNGQIAPAIRRFDFAKSNSWTENWEILLSVALLVWTKSWFLGAIAW